MRNMLVLGIALCLGGCATMVRGADEEVAMNSEPAGAAVRTNVGLSCPSTPCTIAVPRKSDFTATFAKEGFKEQQVAVGTKLSGGGAAGMAGNVLAGGVIGIGVDAATGAAMDHDPNPVLVKLEPLSPARAKPRVAEKRNKAKPMAMKDRASKA